MSLLLELWSDPQRLHAAVVHLPIALALLGIPLVYLCAVLATERDVLRWVAASAYGVLVLVALLAESTGGRAEDEIPRELPHEVWEVVEQHEEMAEQVWIFGAATTVLLLLSILRIRWFRTIVMTLAMVLSLATGVWVTWTAHYGGALVYDHGVGTPGVIGLVQPPAAPGPLEEPVPPAEAPPPPSGEAPVVPEPPVEGDTTTPMIRPLGPADAAATVSFVRDIRPLLEARCLKCHSGAEARGDLRLTSVSELLASGRKSGPAIVPGKPDDSAVVQHIRGIRRPQMPRGGAPLTDDELHLIRLWIAGGAKDDSAAPSTPAPATGLAPEAPVPPPSTPADRGRSGDTVSLTLRQGEAFGWGV